MAFGTLPPGSGVWPHIPSFLQALPSWHSSVVSSLAQNFTTAPQVPTRSSQDTYINTAVPGQTIPKGLRAKSGHTGWLLLGSCGQGHLPSTPSPQPVV